MTPKPTARPASKTLNHGRFMPGTPRKPMAANIAPKPMTCDATPQHAVEKKSEFKATATPPSTHATGANLSCRKQNAAQTPAKNIENGQRSFAYINGESMVRRMDETAGGWLTPSPPSQFKSTHSPFITEGMLFCSATIPPNGPSLENIT